MAENRPWWTESEANQGKHSAKGESRMVLQTSRFWHGPPAFAVTAPAFIPSAHAQVAEGPINYTYKITTEQFTPGSTTPVATNTITTTTNQIERAAAKLADKEINNAVMTGSIGTVPTPGTTNFTHKVTISRFTAGSATSDATHMFTTTTVVLQNLGALVATHGVSQLTASPGQATSTLRAGKTTASLGSNAKVTPTAGSAHATGGHRV
jgi:hypothetical protein